MKKFICMMVAFFALAISAFAYNSATCEIKNGDGASVVAEVTGGGKGVVYLNLHNDSYKMVNLTVTVTYSSSTGTKTFLVDARKSTPVEIAIPGQSSVNINPSLVSVEVSGARCQ